MNQDLKDADSYLHRHRRLDPRPRIISQQLKILVFETENIAHFRIDLHRWQWAKRAGKLEINLLQMIDIQVRISTRPDEITGSRSQTCAIIIVNNA